MFTWTAVTPLPRSTGLTILRRGFPAFAILGVMHSNRELLSVDDDRPALRGVLPTGAYARVAALLARGVVQRAAGLSGVSVAELDHTNPSASGGSTLPADIVLVRPEAFYARLGVRGLIGLGESYVAGDWESPDLGGTLTKLCRRITTLVPGWMQSFRKLYRRRRPESQKNTIDGARRNVSAHYDLSNDFFGTFLDPGLSYSSALFDDSGEGSTLADAQETKVRRMLDRAGVGEGSRVLEIGTGWGDLALHAGRRGATVHSVTLSNEQAELARKRIEAEGLQDRVIIEIKDYREVTGSYDAVVSVEMIEAVGAEYWDEYMRTVHDRLAPGGRAVIQAIHMDHRRMQLTADAATWITTYIFPGGLIPSVRALNGAAVRAGLRPGMQRNFGPDYARTLELWDDSFLKAVANGAVSELGFGPDFQRAWHFYLCYCLAGFAAGYIDVGQLEYRRMSDVSLS